MERGLKEEITSYIDDAAKRGFKWGDNDCALFANNMLVKCLGFYDVGANFRGKYSNFKDALRVTRELGYLDIPDIAQTHLRCVKTDYALGDVALYTNSKALGVCAGEYSWFLGLKGLVRVESRKINKFWRYD